MELENEGEDFGTETPDCGDMRTAGLPEVPEESENLAQFALLDQHGLAVEKSAWEGAHMEEEGTHLGEKLPFIGTRVDRAVFPIDIHGEPAARAFTLFDPVGGSEDFTVEPRCIGGLQVGYSSDHVLNGSGKFTPSDLIFLAAEWIKAEGANVQQVRSNILALARENKISRKEMPAFEAELDSVLAGEDRSSE